MNGFKDRKLATEIAQKIGGDLRVVEKNGEVFVQGSNFHLEIAHDARTGVPDCQVIFPSRGDRTVPLHILASFVRAVLDREYPEAILEQVRHAVEVGERGPDEVDKLLIFCTGYEEGYSEFYEGK